MKTISKLKLTILGLLTLPLFSFAQGQIYEQFGGRDDSTSSSAFTNAYTAQVGLVGICGTSAGATFASPSGVTNACSRGTASSVTQQPNGTLTWDCTGQGANSTSYCVANLIPQSGFVTVSITSVAQCTGGSYVVQGNTAVLPYNIVNGNGSYANGLYSYGANGSWMPGQWVISGSTIGMQAQSLISYSVSGVPVGIPFPPISVYASDGCGGGG